MESCVPNLKSLAQVVFEILRSKRIGVTSISHIRLSIGYRLTAIHNVTDDRRYDTIR